MVIICAKHIFGQCPKCIFDEKNKQCKDYFPVIMWAIKVGDDDALNARTGNKAVGFDGKKAD